MSRLIFQGKVHDGKIITDGQSMRKMTAKYFDGKEIQIIIERKKKTRSSSQNRYYWGVIVDTLRKSFQEYSPDQLVTKEIVHELLKDRFLPIVTGGNPPQVVTPLGEVLDCPYTTTVLSKKEMVYYCDLIKQWGLEMNIYIQDPWERFEDKDVNIDKDPRIIMQ
jgi:hypothetical protein